MNKGSVRRVGDCVGASPVAVQGRACDGPGVGVEVVVSGEAGVVDPAISSSAESEQALSMTRDCVDPTCSALIKADVTMTIAGAVIDVVRSCDVLAVDLRIAGHMIVVATQIYRVVRVDRRGSGR